MAKVFSFKLFRGRQAASVPVSDSVSGGRHAFRARGARERERERTASPALRPRTRSRSRHTLAATRPAGLGYAAVLALLALALPASAAGPEITLDQALQAARRANRTLVAERARLEQAQTNLSLAWTALFPVVAAQGKYTRNNIAVSFDLPTGNGGPPEHLVIQPSNQLDGIINFTAPLIAPPADAALQAVKTGVRAAEADYQTSTANVLNAVAQAFFAAGIADEVLAARQSSIEVASATVQIAQTRYTVGAVTKADVDRAQLALVRADQAAREARFGREQAYRALGTLTQWQGEFTVKPNSEFVPTPEPDGLDTALRLRPEFRALQLTAQSLTTQSHAYAWRWSPTLSAFGNARIFNYDSFAMQRHAWAVGATLDWVLFDGGVRDAQRRQAAAQAREAYARGEVLRESIRDDLANQRGLLETKRHAHDAAEQQVGLAQETLDLVRTQYQAGSVAELDLLRAQDDLTAAREALAQAHYEVALADLGLRRAAGTFPGDIGK